MQAIFNLNIEILPLYYIVNSASQYQTIKRSIMKFQKVKSDIFSNTITYSNMTQFNQQATKIYN